jgi:hypothetical protein
MKFVQKIKHATDEPRFKFGHLKLKMCGNLDKILIEVPDMLHVPIPCCIPTNNHTTLGLILQAEICKDFG